MAANGILRVFVGSLLSVLCVATSAQNLADLSVTVSGPTRATFGNPVIYTIAVTNNGPDVASNVVLNIDPLIFPFGSVSDPCSAGFPCALGSIGANQSVLIPSVPVSTPYLYCPQCLDPLPLVFAANVTGGTPDPNSVNNRALTTTSVFPVRRLEVAPIDTCWLLVSLGSLLGLSAASSLRRRS